MNRENPIARPYDGLEGFEDLAEKITVSITSIARERWDCRNGDIADVPSVELRSVQIEVSTDWSADDVKQVLDSSGLDIGEIQVLVIADAKFLRERSIIEAIPMAHMPERLRLAASGQARPTAMLDKRHGFTIHVMFVLATELQRLPLRPWRKGTLLAESVVRVKPNDGLDGLDPEPLTEDVRKEHGLAVGTNLFVLTETGDLLGLESLTGNVRVFVNETNYVKCTMSRSKLTAQYMTGAALDALREIVYMVSAELAHRDDISDIEDDMPMILRLISSSIEQQVPNAKNLIPEGSLVSMIKNEPNRVAAAISAAGGYSADWATLLEPIEEPEEDQ